jgi:membrane-associated phospholipid phosphatase
MGMNPAMTKPTAALISTLGHPFLLLPVVLSWLTISQLPFEQAWPTSAAMLAGFAVMGVFLFFRKRKGKISNWDVSVQSERARNIYRPILVLVLLTAGAMHYLRQPFVGETLFFGLMMAVCYGINIKVKISQHTLIATYLSFLVMPAKLWAGMAMLAFAPFVAWSRLVLGRHQRDEVWAGGLVGFVFGMLHIWLFG